MSSFSRIAIACSRSACLQAALLPIDILTVLDSLRILSRSRAACLYRTNRWIARYFMATEVGNTTFSKLSGSLSGVLDMISEMVTFFRVVEC